MASSASGTSTRRRGESTVSEFDRIASQYRSLVDQAIEGSGSGEDYFADRKARYVARLVGNDFSGKVLDFGCGVGLVSSFLRNFLPQVTLHGYDESVASLQHVGSQLRAA